MKSLNKSLGKVSRGVPTISGFTFVPAVQKLPIKGVFTEEVRSGALTGKQRQNFAASHENSAEETMADGDVLRAEIIFIKDSLEGGAGNAAPAGTTFELKAALDHTSLPQTSAPVGGQSENTPRHEAPGTAAMETTANKHRGISQQRCHHPAGRAEVSSGFFANKVSDTEERASPTDVFPTPGSSRESILSDGSDKEKSWSAVRTSAITSPDSLSRTVSPCSSVLSGIFSPAVVQIKRHFLAPGSSLVHIPQTSFSSCESLTSPVCPQSPPPRHRPPLTRLSLLTAILRKGRLPVLSSALQRPYTPCWPVNPVTLSFCNACSAASSVASIPLELSSMFSSSASIDSQHHAHREPARCVTAPAPVQPHESSRTCSAAAERCSEQIRSRSAPRWEQVSSPRPRGGNLPQAPIFYSKFKSVSPPDCEQILDCVTSAKLHHNKSVSESPELKRSSAHMDMKGRVDNDLKKLISPPREPNATQDTPEPRKSLLPNSSLSKLHWLSEQLRSPPRFLPQLHPSPSPAAAASPLQNTAGRCESAKGDTPSHGFHGLSASRYTPIVFPGWPSPTSTPTPTASPAPLGRDFTPSPSHSWRSTPSPRPGSGISDCSGREGKKRKPHKIKMSYKSLAAIPTNTLLLDQQVIDEQVERDDTTCDPPGRGAGIGDADTHAEMCSPAQLRQQSEELYATIDEILANSLPASQTSSRTPATDAGLQNNSSFPKSLGRETKYASICSLHPSAAGDRKLMDTKQTKPGVIRPMSASPRLMLEDEKYQQKPLRQSGNKQGGTLSLGGTGRSWTLREQRQPGGRFLPGDLQITEPGDQMDHPGKDAVATSFSAAARRMDAFETHI
ncbi:uncharacterized protein mlip [Aulostomus maculatus]